MASPRQRLWLAGLRLLAVVSLASLAPSRCQGGEQSQLQCLEVENAPGGCPASIMKGACYSSQPGAPWACMEHGMQGLPPGGCAVMGLPPPNVGIFYDGYCSFFQKPSTSTTSTTTTPCPRSRLRVINRCWQEPIWMAHEAANGAIGPGKQNVKIEPDSYYDFCTPDKLTGTRYWPKMKCRHGGTNCLLGGSGGPGEGCSSVGQYGGCAPPIDTKFEATFGVGGTPCNARSAAGCDFIDMSLVDGWTLPFKLTMDGQCNGNGNVHPTEIDCSKLSFDACPTMEQIGSVAYDLQARHWGMGSVTGCYSPCLKLTDSKMNNTAALGHKREDTLVAPYCCPTPPISPEACRNGPIEKTGYVKSVHKYCPGVYGYAYDDAMGLLQCSADTYYTLEFFCPSTMPSWDYVWVTSTTTVTSATVTSTTATSLTTTKTTATMTTQTRTTVTETFTTVTVTTVTATTVTATTVTATTVTSTTVTKKINASHSHGLHSASSSQAAMHNSTELPSAASKGHGKASTGGVAAGKVPTVVTDGSSRHSPEQAHHGVRHSSDKASSRQPAAQSNTVIVILASCFGVIVLAALGVFLARTFLRPPRDYQPLGP